VSTIGVVLQRAGLTVPRRGRRWARPAAPRFKGWFRTSDGQRCEPLTISDLYSRYLLRCQVVAGPPGRARAAVVRSHLSRVRAAARDPHRQRT